MRHIKTWRIKTRKRAHAKGTIANFHKRQVLILEITPHAIQPAIEPDIIIQWIDRLNASEEFP
jgi:hypothetical protein